MLDTISMKPGSEALFETDFLDYRGHSREDDGNDKPIDGDSLAEDDGHQVLGLDARRAHAGAHH